MIVYCRNHRQPIFNLKHPGTSINLHKNIWIMYICKMSSKQPLSPCITNYCDEQPKILVLSDLVIFGLIILQHTCFLKEILWNSFIFVISYFKTWLLQVSTKTVHYLYCSLSSLFRISPSPFVRRVDKEHKDQILVERPTVSRLILD